MNNKEPSCVINIFSTAENTVTTNVEKCHFWGGQSSHFVIDTRKCSDYSSIVNLLSCVSVFDIHNTSGELGYSCNGSARTVEAAGEYRETHQPRDPGGKDPCCWYPHLVVVCSSFTWELLKKKKKKKKHHEFSENISF